MKKLVEKVDTILQRFEDEVSDKPYNEPGGCQCVCVRIHLHSCMHAQLHNIHLQDRERAKRNRRIELNKWRSWSLSRPPTIDEEEGEEEEEDGGAHP